MTKQFNANMAKPPIQRDPHLRPSSPCYEAPIHPPDLIWYCQEALLLAATPIGWAMLLCSYLIVYALQAIAIGIGFALYTIAMKLWWI
jgi:hypothetical protein